jgi:hypothetical protein
MRGVGDGAQQGVAEDAVPVVPCPPRRRWRASLRVRTSCLPPPDPPLHAGSGRNNRARGFSLRRVAAALALNLAGGLANPASAEQQPLPRIWDLQLPTRVSDLPEEEFVDPACGTNGGPPGLVIGTFERFERCRPEASGLREISFRYDDELEFIARAARDPDAIARNNAMLVLGQPVTLSLLVDRSGLVQGYRIFTDPRADEEVRMEAYSVAIAFKARFGTQGWTCSDLLAAEGETPILGIFVKERCEKLMEGEAITVESRHYYKPGQAMLDPNTGLPMANQFESSARLQVVRENALAK